MSIRSKGKIKMVGLSCLVTIIRWREGGACGGFVEILLCQATQAGFSSVENGIKLKIM